MQASTGGAGQRNRQSSASRVWRTNRPATREQIVRWLELPLDEHQRLEINRLNAVLDQMKDAIEHILSLAKNGH